MSGRSRELMERNLKILTNIWCKQCLRFFDVLDKKYPLLLNMTKVKLCGNIHFKVKN